ncbi:MAG: hypothetical protein Q3993_02770, partial [Filifactor alocis]|nr:hypothetical protein [Filifactor alocis]
AKIRNKDKDEYVNTLVTRLLKVYDFFTSSVDIKHFCRYNKRKKNRVKISVVFDERTAMSVS